MSYSSMYSGLMPGEWDALQEAMKRTGNPFGRPSANPAAAMRGGILGTLDERLKPFGGLLGVGANLLSQSGQTSSFGGALGNALLQGQQRVSESEQDNLRRDFMQAQIEKMRTPDRGRLLPVLRGGKIVYEYEDKAAGAEVPQEQRGASNGPSEVEIAQMLNDPNTPDGVKRTLRDLINRKYPGQSAQEPLVAVQVGDRSVLVPRSQAAGMTPAAPREGAIPTEGERTSAFLLSRLENSMKTLSDVGKTNRSAMTPSVAASVAGTLPGVGPVARNTLNSTDRQRVEAAQLDYLDAALTLGTGAAYTREQLEGYRQTYFPQLGDDPQTVKDKEARLAALTEAARTKAGRAAPGNRPPPARPGQSGAPVLRFDANGNPIK